MQRLTVGARCERLYREQAEARELEAIQAATDTVRREHEKANKIPLHKRSEWLKSSEYEDHKDDIEFALQTDQKLGDDQSPSRVLKIKPKRPYGIKSPILKQVANEMGISERLVQTCWDEFREFDKD